MSTEVWNDEQASLIVPPSHTLYEIVNGERVELAEMGINSNLIAGSIYFLLRLFVERMQLGTVAIEALVILDREGKLRRRPDVCFVSAEQWPVDRDIPELGDWDVVPELAIEVISPHDGAEDARTKVLEDFSYGVKEVWQILPVENEVHRYTGPRTVSILAGDEVLQTPLLAGFELPIDSLFKRNKGNAAR